MKGIFVPIYFSFDKYDLSNKSIGDLGRIASFLKDNPSVRVLIEGNADEIGSAEYNIGLGERRARIAKDSLVSVPMEYPTTGWKSLRMEKRGLQFLIVPWPMTTAVQKTDATNGRHSGNSCRVVARPQTFIELEFVK